MYNSFAAIYDSFMDNVPYGFWADRATAILKDYGINDGIVAELGCGTGTFTECMAARGFDMIGIDCSSEMLAEAMNKREKSGYDILYLCQDMREFELYGTVKSFLSVCDSMNYITKPDDLVKVFKLVNNYLDPKGLFIFDMKSEYMYRELLAGNAFARNNEFGSYIWQNEYYPKEKINEYELTMYIRDDSDDICEDGDDEECIEEDYEDDTRFIRSREVHVQRAYSIEELKSAADEAGLEWISATDANTDGEIDDESERFLIVLRERGK